MSQILVVDASVVIDLLARFRPEPIEALLWPEGTMLAAPELLSVEVLNALRKLDQAGAIPPRRHDTLVGALQALPIRKYRHDSLMTGIWALRHNTTAYDAAYIVLARLLDAPLLTRDQRLAAAPGLGVRTIVP